MEKNVIRIRVDLGDLEVPASFRYVWVAVNQTILNTIKDFKVLLSKKFNLNERKEINLYCQQCLLPSDETIFILRDEDFVKIVYGDKPSLNVESSYNSNTEITNGVKNSNTYEVAIKDSHEQSSRSQGDYACINKVTSKKRLCSDSPDTAPPPKKTLCTSGEKSKIRDDGNIIQKKIFEDSEEQTSFDQNKMKVKKKRKKHKTGKKNLLHMECKELMDKANESTEHSFITESNKLDFQTLAIENSPEKIDKSESKNSYTDNSKDYSQKEVMNKEIKPGFQEEFLHDDASLSSEESSARKEILENTSTVTEQSPIGHSSEYSKTPEMNISQLSGNNCRKRKRRSRRNKKATPNSALPNSVGDVLARLPVNTTAAACNITISEDAKLSECASLTTKICGDKIESVQECGRKHIRFRDASDENENIVSSQTPSTDITKELKQNAVEDSQTKIPLWMVWGTPVSKENTTLAETDTTSSLSTTCKEQKTVEQGRSLESLTKMLPLILMPNGLTKALNNNLPTAEVLEQEEIKKPNYAEYPALNTQPSPGDVIAFKMLELSESYCPEVSDYKEGRIKNVYPESDNIELELISEELKQPRIGKFENLYPDETPRTEVVKTVKVRWSSMIEPKLLPS